MATTIYLIRHSGPFVEIDNYSNGNKVLWSEFNKNMILSPKGEENAKRLCNVEELRNISELYSSNSSRAIETAKYLSELNNLKIKLDDRINEREFGVKYFDEIPENFTKDSLENKDLKVGNGESLNELDTRFKNFINELLNNEKDNVVIVLHGIILLSYLKTICTHFTYDGKNFEIKFNNNIVLNGKPNNPSIYKIQYDENKTVINVEQIEIIN